MFDTFKTKSNERFDEGATAVEYAIMASAIAAVVVVITYEIGARVLEYFERFYNLYIIQ